MKNASERKPIAVPIASILFLSNSSKTHRPRKVYPSEARNDSKCDGKNVHLKHDGIAMTTSPIQCSALHNSSKTARPSKICLLVVCKDSKYAAKTHISQEYKLQYDDTGKNLNHHALHSKTPQVFTSHPYYARRECSKT